MDISTPVTPTCASVVNTTISAISNAASTCASIAGCMVLCASSPIPPVSTNTTWLSPNEQVVSRRSTVTPGLSPTMALRLPSKRLNKVDFPTFGRPTIAITGRRSGFIATP